MKREALFKLAVWGITGGMVQMISHGLVSGALFLCVGVMYDRLHSRQIADYGGVVPELASRAHQRLILPVVGEALQLAGIGRAPANLRILAAMYSTAGMFVVRADSPARTIEDLRGRPVAFGAKGSGLVILARYVLDGLGLPGRCAPAESRAARDGRARIRCPRRPPADPWAHHDRSRCRCLPRGLESEVLALNHRIRLKYASP